MQDSRASVDWAEVEKKIFTEEELAECDFREALLKEIINGKYIGKINQDEYENMIAKIVEEDSDPHMSTVVRILLKLGKTIEIVPLKKA